MMRVKTPIALTLLAFGVSVVFVAPILAQSEKPEKPDPPSQPESRRASAGPVPEQRGGTTNSGLGDLGPFVSSGITGGAGPLSIGTEELEFTTFVGYPLGPGLASTFRISNAFETTYSFGVGFQAFSPTGFSGVVSLEMVVTPLTRFGELVVTSSLSRAGFGAVTFGMSTSVMLTEATIGHTRQLIDDASRAINELTTWETPIRSELQAVDQLMRGLTGGAMGVPARY